MNKRIVVWSDFPFVASMVADWLERGYEVTAFTYGEDSPESVGELMPDLVILDAPIREFDFTSLRQALREDKVTSRIPVLTIEGAFDRESSERERSAMADASLLKPFSPESLRSRVESLLRPEGELEMRPIAEPGPREEFTSPDRISISDEELDEAVEEALRELKLESEMPPGAEPDISPEELDMGIDTMDEGVGAEEAAELLEGSTLEAAEEPAEKDVVVEVASMNSQPEEVAGTRNQSRDILKDEIDAIVNEMMARMSEELKARLTSALNDKVARIIKRSVQELLPKLSERLISEMFSSEGEK